MKALSLVLLIVFVPVLSACSSSQPMTKEDMAAMHGMTVEEYDEMSDAAARMNMTMEEHMKMMEE